MTRGTSPSGTVRADGSAAERWTVLKLMLWSADYLEAKGVETPRLDAEHLLAHALGLGRLEMYLQHERLLEPAELDGFRPLLKRRAKREPLQYILGQQAFRELELEVGPEALIPRPETEILVDEVLERVREAELEDLVGFDLGTGSGAIALALLTEGPFREMVATDTSEAALALARRNADAAGVLDRLTLRSGALFAPVERGELFDVVASNPPYVGENDRDRLPPEVVEWEPHQALFAGPDGLEILGEIASEAGRVLRPRGLLALEVGAGQAEWVATRLAETGMYRDVRVRKDLAGKQRIVSARRAAERN